MNRRMYIPSVELEDYAFSASIFQDVYDVRDILFPTNVRMMPNQKKMIFLNLSVSLNELGEKPLKQQKTVRASYVIRF